MSFSLNAEKKSATFDLISASKNIQVGDWELNSSELDLQSAVSWSIRKKTLHGGLQEGVEVVVIDNGALVIQVVPTRGMNILRVDGNDVSLGWDSPVKEVVHPAFVNLNDRGGLGWLDSFSEWMVRCGIEYSGHPGEDNGRDLSLHGRIAHIPASEVSVEVVGTTPPTLKLRGLVQERWFKGVQFVLSTTLSTVIGSNTFELNDTITNEASDEKEFQILYHANFAEQLLEAGSKLYGTIKSVQPFNQDAAVNLRQFDRYGPPAKVLAGENVFQIVPRSDDSGYAHFLLSNASSDRAVSFSFSVDSLPYFTLWKNEDSKANGYVTGLEPGNCYPSNRSHERTKGRIQKIKGGESLHFQLKYSLHSTKESVQDNIQKIKALNEGFEIDYVMQAEH